MTPRITPEAATALRKMLSGIQEKCMIGTGWIPGEPHGTPRLSGEKLAEYISETGFRLVDEMEGVVR